MASTSIPATRVPPHPHIHLLFYEPTEEAAFRAALEEYPWPAAWSWSSSAGSLRQLDRSLRFDCLVSPANSYGRMDGAYDDALSKAVSASDDYFALTHVVQQHLWREWRGFAPPGTCTLVPYTFASYDQHRPTAARPWGARLIAVCPTMRTPADVRWDREVVYECVWSLLCAIARWNATASQSEKIERILMTPLATGIGLVPPARWAAQLLLALRHYDEACRHPAQWSALEFDKIFQVSGEVEATYETRPNTMAQLFRNRDKN